MKGYWASKDAKRLANTQNKVGRLHSTKLSIKYKRVYVMAQQNLVVSVHCALCFATSCCQHGFAKQKHLFLVSH